MEIESNDRDDYTEALEDLTEKLRQYANETNPTFPLNAPFSLRMIDSLAEDLVELHHGRELP